MNRYLLAGCMGLMATFSATAQDALYVKNGASIALQPGAVVNVKGNVTLENGSTLLNQGSIYVEGSTRWGPGHWTDHSAIRGDYGSGRFIFNGAGNQLIKSPHNFSLLETTGIGLELQSDIRARKWILEKGSITTGSFVAIVTDPASNAVEAGPGNTNFSQSWVNGTLRRYITPAAVNSYSFPVGNASAPHLAILGNLQNNSLSGISYVDVNITPKAGSDGGLLVTEHGASYVTVAPEAVWNISADAAPGGAGYDLSLYFNGFANLADNQFAILQRPMGNSNGADWTKPAGSTLPAIGQPGRVVANGFATRNGITTLGQFGIGLSLTALPVTLSDFQAHRLSPALVQLNWETTTEQNNKGFDVERRWQTDNEFRSIGFIPSQAANGNSQQLLHYQYTDANSYTGITYYRLKQTDLDNRSAYTLIRAVKGAGNNVVTVSMWPNPNNGQFSIRIDGNTRRLPAFIVDMAGKTVQQVTIYENKPVNIRGLSAGTYVVSIPGAFGEGEGFREKVLVVR